MDLNHMHIISCLQVRNTPAGTNRSLQEVLHFPTSSGNLVASLWPENDQQIDIAVYILPGKRLVCGIDNLLIAHILTYATQKSAAHNLKFFEPTGPGKNQVLSMAFHDLWINYHQWNSSGHTSPAEVVRPPVCCSTALRQHSSTLSLRRWPEDDQPIDFFQNCVIDHCNFNSWLLTLSPVPQGSLELSTVSRYWSPLVLEKPGHYTCAR